MYWPNVSEGWREAHNSFGVDAKPGLRWGLADGRLGGPRGYATFILLANPNPHEAEVRRALPARPASPRRAPTRCAPTSRLTIQVSADMPRTARRRVHRRDPGAEPAAHRGGEGDVLERRGRDLGGRHERHRHASAATLDPGRAKRLGRSFGGQAAPLSRTKPPVHLQVQRRQHEQGKQRRGHEPADHDDGQRALDLGPVQPKHAAAGAAPASPCPRSSAWVARARRSPLAPRPRCRVRPARGRVTG